MLTRLDEIDASRRDLSDQQYNFYSKFSSIDMEQLLRLPRNFDPSKIKGFVANLINVQNMDYVAAIEKAAAGKLYNLVVDTSATAQFLLKNKCLKRAVTMIPLDKIRSRPAIDPRKVQLGKQRVGAQNCFSLRNLVTCDREFDGVADFVFNGFMVARTSDMAHDLCFSRDIHVRCLSAGGADFSPDGVLSGGKTSTMFILKEIAQLNKIEQNLDHYQREYLAIKKELDQLEARAAEFTKLDKHRNTVATKKAQIETRLQASEFGQLQQEHDRAEAELVRVDEAVKVAQEEHDKLAAEADEIETRMKNLEKNRDKELKKLQAEVDKKRSLRDKALELVEKHQANFDGLALEIEELDKEAKTTLEELESKSAESSEISKALEAALEIVNEHQKAIDEVKELINEQREIIASRDAEMTEKKNAEKSLKKKVKEIETGIAKAQAHIER